MEATIYIPDDLAERVQQKLDIEGQQTLSDLIQKALERELAEQDISYFLAHAGIIAEAPKHADEEAEDF